MIKATSKLEPNSKATNSNYKHHERNKITLTANIMRPQYWEAELQGEPFTGGTLLQVMLGHWSLGSHSCR